jgi:hypothetical protein
VCPVLLIQLVSAAVLLCLSLVADKGADALEIQRVNKFQLGLNGPIEPGDFKKIEAYLINPDSGGRDIDAVYLNSPGDNFAEAMRIGGLLRELFITTVIQTDDTTARVECSSACFFIFAGGIQRSVWWAGRNLPVVELHGPKNHPGNASGSEPEQALGEDMEHEARSYLRNMGIEDPLIERMFKTSSAGTDVLHESELRTLNSMVPYYEERLLAQCGALTLEEQQKYTALLLAGALNEEHPLSKKQGEIESCRYKVRHNDRLNAFVTHETTATRAGQQTR